MIAMFLKIKLIKLALISFTVLFLCSIYFFTGSYLNLLKEPFQKIISKYLDANIVEYNKIEGNFISGFKIVDIVLDSDNYSLSFNQIHISLGIFDLLRGCDEIDFLEFKDGKLVLKVHDSDRFENQYLSQFNVGRIHAIDSEVLYGESSILLEELDTSLSSGIFYNVESKGTATLPYYNLEVDNFYIKSSNSNYSYSAVIRTPFSEKIKFDKFEIMGNMDSFSKIRGIFTMSDLSVFEKDFYDISGEVDLYNNIFFIRIKNQYALNSIEEKFSIGADLQFSDKVLKVRKAILQFNSRDSVTIKNENIHFNKYGFSSDSLYLKYNNGGALIRNARINSFYNYKLDIQFNDLDISLFKGLGANGYLSGNLNILNGDSIYFSDAKVESFSYKDYSFDSVDIEGSFNNNELSLSGLKISKQIGLLNLSGSYSSLDDFYSEFIKGLKLKFKN